MHEIAFADKVLREAEKAGATRYLSVEVGELCEIEADELEEAFENLVDWKLNITERKSKISCQCGYVGEARIVDRGHGYCVWNCPSCGLSGKNINVLEGGEIKIVEVE